MNKQNKRKIKNIAINISTFVVTISILGIPIHLMNNDKSNVSNKIPIKLEENKIAAPETISVASNNNQSEEVKVPSPTPSLEPIDQELVALTFDDGPSAYTKELLDLLEEYDVKATFFVVGYQCEKYPEVLTEIIEDGHEIGMHGYTHTSFTKLTLEEVNNELSSLSNYIEALDLPIPTLVRPPYGSYNDEIQTAISYPFIYWNIDTEDWKTKDKDAIKTEILDNISPGAIILMHDTKAVHEVDIKALEELLPELKEEYRFVTIQELCEEYQKTLENGKVYGKIKKNTP